jgi:chorismate mutase/prephenate dehydratase
MRKYNVYIARAVNLEINHCLAAKSGTSLESIKKVYSHPQALSQCSEFIKSCGLKPVESINTAAAAKYANETEECCGAICSESCAELYGMDILKRKISNVLPNYTRFICITKDFCLSEDADTVAVNLVLPNVKGSLYRMLTKFYMNDLNLKKIESRPVADGSFDVMFYLDFEGNISSPKTKSLINELSDELEYFKFLGNYSEIG